MKTASPFTLIKQGLCHIMEPGEELVFTSRRPPEEVKAFLKKAPSGGMFRRGADVWIRMESIEIAWIKGISESSFFSPMFRGEIHADGTGSIIRGYMLGFGPKRWSMRLQIFLILLNLIVSIKFKTFFPILGLCILYMPSKIFAGSREAKITELLLDACSSSLTH